MYFIASLKCSWIKKVLTMDELVLAINGNDFAKTTNKFLWWFPIEQNIFLAVIFIFSSVLQKMIKSSLNIKNIFNIPGWYN